MSEVKRYGHIAYLVTATDQMLELYPDMKVYVLASDFDSVRHDLSEMTDNYNIVVRQKMEFAKDRDAAQSELAALREELETAKDDLVIFKGGISALGEASKKLVFCARTTGGTAGPDQGLMDACASVEWTITLAGIARAMNELEQLTAERDDLKVRLADAERRNAELQKDKDRLDALEVNFWDVRHGSHPIADTGDSSSSLEIVGNWMDKPFERVIGEDYSENLRAAIDQAMKAPAYPPERPEYPEIDAALTKPEEAKS